MIFFVLKCVKFCGLKRKMLRFFIDWMWILIKNKSTIYRAFMLNFLFFLWVFLLFEAHKNLVVEVLHKQWLQPSLKGSMTSFRSSLGCECNRHNVLSKGFLSSHMTPFRKQWNSLRDRKPLYRCVCFLCLQRKIVYLYFAIILLVLT